MITARNLVYRYHPNASRPALDHITLEIASSEYLLIAGRSGSGKSTLCRTFNGLIPHFHGGFLEGELHVAGRVVEKTPIAELFRHVAMVLQNPDAQLFCRSVEKEIVFGLESLGLEPKVIESRLDAALDRAGIESLRHCDPHALSGGEKQLVLIAALSALQPSMLVLDEPFANLDPANVTRVRALLKDLHAAGTGIVIGEHRLSKSTHDATRMIVLDRGRLVADGSPETILAHADPAWGLEPSLAARMGATAGICPDRRTPAETRAHEPPPGLIGSLVRRPPCIEIDRKAPPLLAVDGLYGRHGDRTVLKGIGFTLHAGECVAVVGANGAGKTSLLRHLMGLQTPVAGTIRLRGRDTRKDAVSALARAIGLAFQNPDNQFFKDSVEAEIRTGPDALGVLDEHWLEDLGRIFDLGPLCSKSPFRLSGGEKKRVSFASALASKPALLLLDEPTAGQDFIFRRNLCDLLSQLQANGQAMVIVTHDLAFAASAARRWLLMIGGRLLADAIPERIMADNHLMALAGLDPAEGFELSRMDAPADRHPAEPEAANV